MDMHTGTIIAKYRLGHECDGLTMLASRILYDVFIEHHVVCGLEQRIVTDIDLCLSWSTDFMVLCFDQYAEFFERHGHLTTNVLECVIGGNREVPFLHTHAVTEVGSAVAIARAVPMCFVRVNFSILNIFGGIVEHIIE